ncbi:MAG: PLP-dependent aspartate aminotransferase family protein [Bacteroidales bacterium]|nr:PLP-dependent aspartate aminotransferase family protein [Bacteroidales bacterium]
MDTWEIITHLGENREEYHGAMIPPMYQTSNFKFDDLSAMQTALSDEYHYPVYSRGNNPTVKILREKLAALEGAEDALVFNSGCAAISTLLLSQLKAGDHMVCIAKPYGWVKYICDYILKAKGIQCSFVEVLDNDAGVYAYIQASNENTRLWYLESPNTFTFEVTDIAAVALASKERGIITVIDNSYSTPLYQKPLLLGIDFVIHSASKYLAGHSDVVAGVLCGNSESIKEIYQSYYLALGAVISPQDAWLIIRGLRTLPLRLEQSSKSALEILTAIEHHPRIEKIYYPFHHSHPNYEIAKLQMKSCSGLFSIKLKVDNTEAIHRFCDAFKVFSMAVSWGGFESLIFPALAFQVKDETDQNALSWKIVRFYVGFEEVEVLKNDLLQALAVINS